MRIFYAFLIIVVAAILFMLPVSEAIYDFRTDQREDTFSTATGAGATTANETLLDDLYDDDIGSVDIDSDLATDVPLPSSYNSTSQQLLISGLTASDNRTLTVAYDFDALGDSDAINVFLDRLPWIWLLVICAFAPAALFAIFTHRA